MSHLIAFRHWLTLLWKSIMSGFSLLILLTINNNKLSPFLSLIEFVECKASIIKPSACSLWLSPAFKQFPDYRIAANIFKYNSSVLRNSKASLNISIYLQIYWRRTSLVCLFRFPNYWRCQVFAITVTPCDYHSHH